MPEREHVGHAEVRAHAADVDRDRRLAREAVLRACRRRRSCRRCRRPRSPRARTGTPRRASSSSGRRRTSRPGSARCSRRSSACRRSGSGRPGASMPQARPAPRGRRRRSRRASGRRQAFMIVAFSRSSSPMRPISCERLRPRAGQLGGEQLRGLELELGVDGREHRRDRDRADPCARRSRPRSAAARRGRAARSRARRTRARRARGTRARRARRAGRRASRPSAAAPRVAGSAEPDARGRHRAAGARRRRS